MTRRKSRDAAGRFRRATLANTFGLAAPVCPHCGRFNPHKIGEKPPENCHACGKPLKEKETPC